MSCCRNSNLRIAGQVRDVRLAPGQQVIHAHDGVPLGQQSIAKMRSDESGTAGDHYPHSFLHETSQPTLNMRTQRTDGL